MGDGDESICFTKQVDELLSPDGFKRAALKETFLKAKINFLKTKLLKRAPWVFAGSPGSELSGQLKRHVCPHLAADEISQWGVGWG